jgi:toxin FitB
MYLLDTNVISELRKNKPHGAVLSWFASVAARNLHVPAVAVGELQDGVELTRQHDRLKAAEIERWIDRIVRAFAVIPMDADSFRETARLMAGKPDDLFEDAMIAATARVHRLAVVTRNVKDFAVFGVQVFNPFTYKGKI